MIQANELRIGNAVYCKYRHGHYLVAEINETDIRIKEPERGHKFWESYETVISIPLSPEILEACGFNIVGNLASMEFVPGREFGLREIVIAKNAVILNNKVQFDCNFLHQLQNLYFALTGTELIINLEK